MPGPDENLILGNRSFAGRADQAVGELEDRTENLADLIEGAGITVPDAVVASNAENLRRIIALETTVGSPGPPPTGLFATIAGIATVAAVTAVNARLTALETDLQTLRDAINDLDPVPSPPSPGDTTITLPGLGTLPTDVAALQAAVTTLQGLIGVPGPPATGLYGELAGKVDIADVENLDAYVTDSEFATSVAELERQIGLVTATLSGYEPNVTVAWDNRHRHEAASVMRDFTTAQQQITGGLEVQRLTSLGFTVVAGPPITP